MAGERWVVLGLASALCLVMLARPQWLTFWRIHRTPASLAAVRAVGALGLAAIAIALMAGQV